MPFLFNQPGLDCANFLTHREDICWPFMLTAVLVSSSVGLSVWCNVTISPCLNHVCTWCTIGPITILVTNNQYSSAPVCTVLQVAHTAAHRSSSIEAVGPCCCVASMPCQRTRFWHSLAAICERHTQPADLRREVQELLPGGFSWRRGPMCVAHMHRLLDTGTKETGIR